MRDLTYPPVIVTAKTLFRLLGMRFQMSGTEHVPREGGAILAANHIGYVDFVFDGLAAQPSGRLVRFMAKKEAFDHPVGGPLMRSFHHIEVDRDAGQASYDTAVEYARSGEIVGIFPEATISRSMEIKELKTGAVRMAAEAGVPLIPMVTWGTQLLKTKDHESDIWGRGKTIALFAVPGAFTPTCSAKHLPGYVEQADALKAKGIDEIWCVSVNDAFVMGAWGREQKTEGKVRMLADGSALWTKELGLELDLVQRGMGVRSQRYSALIVDGVVKQLNVEAPGKFEVSDAATMLSQA